jgi:hypothetical protein
MERGDVEALTPREEQVLNLSFRPGLSEKRIRNTVASSVVVLVAIIATAAFGLSAPAMALVAGAIVVVSMIEKITYSREMMDYKGLVRRLVHRM